MRMNFVLVMVVFVIHRTLNSSHGLAFQALRDSRSMAVSVGVKEYKEKLKVFAQSDR